MKLYCRSCYKVYHLDTEEAPDIAKPEGCLACGGELAGLHPITIYPLPGFLELCKSYKVRPETALMGFMKHKTL